MERSAIRRRVITALIAAVLVSGAAVGIYHYRRAATANFHVVVEGKIYRSGQPRATHLKEWRERYGLRTVVNLRGNEAAEVYREEKTATEDLGIRLIDIEWSARRLPGREGLEMLLDTLEKGEKPILLHCAEGVDRTGVASAIAAMAVGGEDFRSALEQVSNKYHRLGPEAGGVAGLLFAYEDVCRKRGVDPGGWDQFKNWLANEYREPATAPPSK